jgi:hypothetical protein
MSIKVSEVGKLFNYGTFYTLTSFSTLSLKFVSPSGVVNVITNPRVSAPATTVIDAALQPLPGGTYMQFATEATDFTEAGTWKVCGTYTDATPKVFYGDDATFTVGGAC